jgi:hypothetical protein
MKDLEMAARSARYIERVALGMKYRADDPGALREADDVLRLAVGLRRMLERLLTATHEAGQSAPPASKER